MSWLNSVLSTPLIGLRIVPDLKLAGSFDSVFAEIFTNKVQSNPRLDISTSSKWDIELKSLNGLRHHVNLENIICEYKYNVEMAKVPGSLPVPKTIDLKPFSELMDECHTEIHQFTKAIIDAGFEVKISRIGIMARANLDPSDMPPGIVKLFEHLSAPWENGLVKSQTVLLANLAEDETQLDRCHHHINMDKVEESPQMDFTLDWQRVFSDPKQFTRIDDFEAVFSKSITDSMDYFEKVGEGIL